MSIKVNDGSSFFIIPHNGKSEVAINTTSCFADGFSDVL
jgi:hypothetical protein